MHIYFTLLFTDQVGCREYMQPQNATVPLPAISVACEPVSTRHTSNMSLSETNVTWLRFTVEDELQQYINNCSSGCCGNSTTVFRVDSQSANFSVVGYNLTIMRPEGNHAWYIPTFEVGGCTRVAPGTYLYRKLAKMSHTCAPSLVLEP